MDKHILWVKNQEVYIDFENSIKVEISGEEKIISHIPNHYSRILDAMSASPYTVFSISKILDICSPYFRPRGDSRKSCTNLFCEMRKVTGLKNNLQSVRYEGYRFVPTPNCERGSIPNKENDYSSSFETHIKLFKSYMKQLTNATLACHCLWGTYSYDNDRQNANSAEGLLALAQSRSNKNEYKNEITDVSDYLLHELTVRGLVSKSLKLQTVAPTSMFLTACDELDNPAINERIVPVVQNLWDARGDSGWGIYIKKMNRHSTIGFSYWALCALYKKASISRDEYEKYVISLFRYRCYARRRHVFSAKFGDDSAPRMYATSMMYILYSMLSDEAKKQVDEVYDSEGAIEYIVDNFDNDFLLTEQESVSGIAVPRKIVVHDVPWDHISIHFSLRAISIAIKAGVIDNIGINTIAHKVQDLLLKHCLNIDGKCYFRPPYLPIDGVERGYRIYPTIHLLQGLQYLISAMEEHTEKQEDSKL